MATRQFSSATRGPDQKADDLSALKARALDDIGTSVMISDARANLIFANDRFKDLMGLQRHDDLCGRALSEICPELNDELSHNQALPAGTAAHEKAIKRQRLIYDHAHHPIWVSLSTTRLIDRRTGEVRFVTSLNDITYTKLHDGLHDKVLEALIQDRPVSYILTLLCNEVEQLLGGIHMSILRVEGDGILRHMAAPSLPETYCQAIDGAPIGPQAGSCGTAAWRKRPTLVTDIATDPLWDDYRQLILPLGYTSCWSTPIIGKDGNVSGTFAFYAREALPQTAFMQHMVNICTRLCTLALEKRDFEDRIAYLAHNDALTGLSNRAFFQTRLFEEAQRAVEQDTSLALHMIDLDRFKEINDTLGHPVGDEVLCLVAETLKAYAAPGDVIARLGGDEFVMLQSGITDISQAEQRAEALVSAVHAGIGDRLMGTGTHAGGSLGFALFPQDADDMDMLVRHADMALYQSKSDGKGVWRAFDRSMAQALHYRRELEGDLRDALTYESESLSLVYQPQLSLIDNSITGFEALLRWKHPHYGFISPADFIPIAEEAGLIGQLGTWILEEACRTAASWSAPYSIAVNISPIQIFEGDLPNLVHEILIRTGLSPLRLELEVTEGVLINNTERAVHILRRLKGLGVRIAMDDFGTGYSSLSYLQTFPFDKIKIDRSFISDLESNMQARAIVRAVIGLASAIHVPVIAEGVETQGQLDLLHEQGCNQIQGYFIGRPMPQESLGAWLKSWQTHGTDSEALRA